MDEHISVDFELATVRRVDRLRVGRRRRYHIHRHAGRAVADVCPSLPLAERGLAR